MGATEEVVLKLSGDSAGAVNALKQVQNLLGPLKQKMDQVSNAGKTMAAVFGGLSAAGTKLIQSTSQVAMRNEVLATSLYTVGERAGYSRQELDGLTDQVKGLGITTSNSRLSLTRMIQSQLDLSKATDLARTSQDLAVIAGENSSATYGNMMEAITSLQPRLLRQYGIVATTDQILGDLAKSTDSVAKRNRFMQYVLEEGAKVAGVYEASMGVVGKQLTSFPRYIEEAKAALGKHFIPVIGKGAAILKQLITWFEKLPEPVQALIARLILFGTAGSAIIAAVGGLLALLPLIVSGFAAVAGAAGPLLAIFAGLAAAVAGLVIVGRVLRSAWEEDWGGIRTAVVGAWTQIKPLVDRLLALFRAWGDRLSGQFREVGAALWDLVTNILTPLFGNIGSLLASIDWNSLFGTLSDALNVALGHISAWLQTINGLLRGEGFQAFAPLHDAFIDVLTMIALTWDKYVKRALAWGYNLVVQITNGIIRAAQSVLVAAMNTIGKIVGRFLAPGSPPQEGPLSQIVKWGQGLMNTYFKSFALADFGLMRDSLSPIQSALESALSAGDIDEAEFGQIFGTVREQVAALISNFRETGQISEEALGQIAESLGPGSEELTKYLRLQLEHQQTLERLKSVQEEVAAAEEAGFIPAELKKKLRAAQDAANVAKDELDWQREYLAMQQESVDLQSRLAATLDKVGDALGRLAGGEEVGAAGAGGIDDVLGFDAGALGAVGKELQGVKAIIGGMTPEFEAMRGKVVGFIAGIREFLTLPFDEKLMLVAQYLQTATGIDFPGFLQAIFDVVENINENGLLEAIQGWIDQGLDYVKDNWEDWAAHIATFVFKAFQAAIEFINERVEEAKLSLVTWMGTIFAMFLMWIEQKYLEWARSIFNLFVRMMVQFITLLRSTASRWTSELVTWLKGIIESFVSQARSKIADWADGMRKVGEVIVEKIRKGIEKAWESMIEWLRNLVWGLREELIEWTSVFSAVGEAIVGWIKHGIDSCWMALVAWFKELLRKLRDCLPGSEPKDPTSPLRNLALAGKALAENFAAGIDFSPVRTALMSELKRTQNTATAAMGPVTIEQTFGDLSFPNVRDGQGALGVRRGIDRRALEAGMMARTGGI